METNKKMTHSFAEYIAMVVCFYGYKLSLMMHMPLSYAPYVRLLITTHPIVYEVIIDTIRLLFTLLATVLGYFALRYIKKHITHEE